MLKLLSHPIVLMVFGVLALVFWFSLDKTAQKRQQSAEIISQLNQEVEKEKLSVAKMEQKKLESEQFIAKDKIIHDELLQKAEGEFVVMIAGLPENKVVETEMVVERTPWEEWREILFE